MGKVSIVIPCFNDGAFVREAIHSALAQTHSETEVVVVDDGSTEKLTLDELEGLRSEGVWVHRQENQGLSAARNSGIRLTTGDYILPLDSDDRIAANYAELAARVLDDQPNVGIVGGGIEFFGLRSGREHPPYDGPASMLFQNSLYTCSLTRRSDWAAVGGYPEHVRFAEDWIYWLRILGLGREVHMLDETIWFYRQREGQMTRTMDQGASTRAIVQAMRDQPDLYAAHMDVVTDHFEMKLLVLDSFRRRFGRINDRLSRLIEMADRRRT